MPTLNKAEQGMVSEFLCPGCTCGTSPCAECDRFSPTKEDGSVGCASHSAGTFMGGVGRILLGLPKGFNRAGPVDTSIQRALVRLWNKGHPEWNHLNIPVWAMEKDGWLYVRTFMPRVNVSMVDVIRGGKLDLCPQAIDVSKFVDEID